MADALSITEGIKGILEETYSQEPVEKTKYDQLDLNGTRSVLEVANEAGMTLEAFVQKFPESAVLIAEASVAYWTHIQTAGAIEGALLTSNGDLLTVNKNMAKLISDRLSFAREQLQEVRELALIAPRLGESNRDHVVRILTSKACKGERWAVQEIANRRDGLPGQQTAGEYDQGYAYAVYSIIQTLFGKQLEVLNSGNGTKLICCSRRAGKCWSPDTLLRKYDGSVVRADAVKVGDIMMGSLGEPQTVVSLATGTDDMYRVSFNKPECGDGFVCNAPHILTVKMTQDISKLRGQYKKIYKQGGIYDIPLNEFIKLPAYVQRRFSLYRTAVDYPERQHIIDPYILGLWLGDGTKCAPEIAVGMNEPEIIEAITDFASVNGWTVKMNPCIRQRGSCYSIRINAGGKGKSSPIIDELRRLNLLNNKHIPQEYLIDSKENRLKLLAGLIDSDGHYARGRDLMFCNIDPALIDGCFELCCSLGFKPTKRWQKKKYYSEAHGQWQIVNSGYVHIKGKLSTIPTLCPRKKATDNKQDNIYGFHIDYVGKGQYNGFTLDGDGRLLLADYTVTHNTQLLVAMCLIECLRRPNTMCIYIGETMNLTEQLVDEKMNQLIDGCNLRDKRGKRLNWKKLDNGSEILVRGLSNTKDPDQIRGHAAKIIVIDEFFHLKSELLSYLQAQVLEPMQLDYADDYKFICAGTPPSIKGTFGEMAWKTWDVPHFFWTWRDNPHPTSLEDRKAYIDAKLEEKGLTWESSYARREYNGEWAYDEDLLLYPEFHTYNPRESLPSIHVDQVLFGIDYGVSDNDVLIGIAWDNTEKRGYVFHEDKFNRLDVKDRSISQLEYLRGQVVYAWEQALDYFPTLSPKEANKRILWDADDNQQHITDDLNMNARIKGKEELRLNIQNAHKTDKVIMFDKIRDLLRTGNLLLPEGGKTVNECLSTILKRGPAGEVFPDIDDNAYHPDILPAMRYALYNVLM